MSYTNNPTTILAGTGISVSPTSGTGANTITISALGTQVLTVRTAIVTPITVTDADDVINVQVPGPVAVAVNLPIGVSGRVFNIKDGLGLASPATPITITPVAGTIDGGATAIINAPYGNVTLVYNGTKWLIL